MSVCLCVCHTIVFPLTHRRGRDKIFPPWVGQTLYIRGDKNFFGGDVNGHKEEDSLKANIFFNEASKLSAGD